MRTDADIRRAYDAWQAGSSWAAVADACGYPSANSALLSVRRYAELNRLPLRKVVRPPPSAADGLRMRRAYCAYLLGEEWGEIAAQFGWPAGPAAQASVTRYAFRNGLPLRRLP